MSVWRTYHDEAVLVRYRLTVEPPIPVTFPSSAWVIEWSHDIAGRHTLKALNLDRTGHWPIYDYQSEHAFALDAKARLPWTEGVSIRHPSALETIFQKLARQRRAEMVIGPHAEVYLHLLRGVIVDRGTGRTVGAPHF